MQTLEVRRLLDHMWRSRIGFAVAVIVIMVAWTASLGMRKLTAPDEGRYAEIAREMVVSGDWITPRYNGLKYFEKPPLQYWATALALRTFGLHDWVVRLWTAIAGLAGVAVTALTMTRIAGRRVGWTSAAVLASTPLWFVGGHVSSLDMGVSLFVTIALCAMLVGLTAAAGRGSERAWILAAWAAMGLAVLSKGLIGVVLPALVVGSAIVTSGRWDLVARLRIPAGAVLMAVVVLPWLIVVAARNPEFFDIFIVREHFQRFVDGGGRRGPWWYFAVLLPLGCLPWLPALVLHLRQGFDTARTGSLTDGFVSTLLWCWVAVVLLFFTVSRSKLPGYILPAVPPIAMLAAQALNGAHVASRLRHIAGWTFAAGLALVVVGGGFWLLAPTDSPRSEYVPYLVGAGGLWMATAAGAWRRTFRVLERVTILAMGIAVGTASLVVGHDAWRGTRSAFDIAQVVLRRLDRSQPFYAVRTFDHTLPYYLQTTFVLVDYEDELASGLAAEPHLGVRDLDTFIARWRADTRPMALVSEGAWEELSARGVPLRTVARDSRRRVVEKP